MSCAPRVFQAPHTPMNPMVPTRTAQSRPVTTPTGRAPRSRAPGPRARRARRGRARARTRAVAVGDRRRRASIAGSEEVGEQPVGARHAGGQLPEERQSRVDVAAVAVLRDQQATEQGTLAGIGAAEDGRVLLAPALGVIEAALLHPAVEVGGPEL